jgi:hypothetical protein
MLFLIIVFRKVISKLILKLEFNNENKLLIVNSSFLENIKGRNFLIKFEIKIISFR